MILILFGTGTFRLDMVSYTLAMLIIMKFEIPHSGGGIFGWLMRQVTGFYAWWKKKLGMEGILGSGGIGGWRWEDWWIFFQGFIRSRLIKMLRLVTWGVGICLASNGVGIGDANCLAGKSLLGIIYWIRLIMSNCRRNKSICWCNPNPQGHWIEDSKKIGPKMQEKALGFSWALG